MLKKIILSVLLVGFTGILVWGGINRTLAKTGSQAESHNPREVQIRSQGGNGGQSLDAHKTENQNQADEVIASQDSNGSDFFVGSSQEDFNNPRGNQSNGIQAGRTGSAGRAQGQGGGRGNEALAEAEIQALLMALDDEYHALAVYIVVIETFGEVEPFVEIAQSEQRHIEALIRQFDKHEIPVPENRWIGAIPPFESVQAACQAGVDAEIANVALYDQLFSMTDDPGLIQVFANLSRASLESHLPQFEACR